ncbi:hypothetical protein BEWA_029170 [Theileria equi strain WA]|uniref:Uncharacterized protein n=1 Tax=Theileria equi strain WA TaxID=1537102 RepID=L0AWV0_THEEQ|nr:hypothetical protein BEWA_029170 [Theileria equi strain WA]AFZ80067.1 hypothetical protein BEWA_029170 [Theileria equi strain WA]|eukprot:XP_004829733.1 hypothetical protein BEWA_029170 [Theileria equi strain WA]
MLNGLKLCINQCLFPLVDSLHGSFSPRVFKLKCDHTFHLLCLFETIQRRECRKVCGECWKEIEEEEQRIIFKEAKKEKKEIASYSHSLAGEILEYNVSSD